MKEIEKTLNDLSDKDLEKVFIEILNYHVICKTMEPDDESYERAYRFVQHAVRMRDTSIPTCENLGLRRIKRKFEMLDIERERGNEELIKDVKYIKDLREEEKGETVVIKYAILQLPRINKENSVEESYFDF